MKALMQLLCVLVFSCLLVACAPEKGPATPVSENFRFTEDDISLLRELHARPSEHNNVGDDGRKVEYLDADDLFDDRGMDLVVAKMPNVRSISLMLCPGVTDRGLAKISDLKHLQSLRLHHSSVTDDGIEQILSLTQLEELDLSGTRTTIAGILKLKQLENLKVILLEEESFTPDEISLLEKTFGEALNLN